MAQTYAISATDNRILDIFEVFNTMNELIIEIINYTERNSDACY